MNNEKLNFPSILKNGVFGYIHRYPDDNERMVAGLSVSISQKGQAGVYNSTHEKDNPRFPVRLERDLYPTHTRAQLKDEETKVEDAKDQYD